MRHWHKLAVVSSVLSIGILAACADNPIVTSPRTSSSDGDTLRNAQHITKHSVEADGLSRSYALSVPDDTSAPMPLIIALHGRGDAGVNFLVSTGLDAAPAFVAAPTGVQGAWAGAPYAETTYGQDSTAIMVIIEDVQRAHAIDPGRIYLVGFSNGGGLATQVAADHPERFAAVATVAAAVRTDPIQLATGAPIDYLNIHGTSDIKVPYDGETRDGDDVIYPAEDVVAAFTHRNGAEARTQHYAVQGMGHQWSAATWGTSASVDTNKEIFSFFGFD